MSVDITALLQSSVRLLEQLITLPSFSREEDKTADLLFQHFRSFGARPQRKGNNVYAFSDNFGDENLPVVLLNSHHDTVRPGKNWDSDPFQAILKEDKLFGLGSNDAGGPLVSLMAVFSYFHQRKNLPFRLIAAFTAEEEVSGANGVRSLLPDLGKIDLGIVGEPTQMDLAIAEKGLIVLDCIAHGRTGHAAREEGENALYKALDDIAFIRSHLFDKVSPLLGKVKMTVTQIQAGTQHNVVPDTCSFVVDIRTNEHYNNLEVIEFLRSRLQSEITSRSYHLNSSSIPETHPIVQKGIQLGRKTYGSVTLSDQAMMDFPTVKIGPGDSARSHTPNEYIKLSEIEEGIRIYIALLEDLKWS